MIALVLWKLLDHIPTPVLVRQFVEKERTCVFQKCANLLIVLDILRQRDECSENLRAVLGVPIVSPKVFQLETFIFVVIVVLLQEALFNAAHARFRTRLVSDSITRSMIAFVTAGFLHVTTGNSHRPSVQRGQRPTRRVVRTRIHRRTDASPQNLLFAFTVSIELFEDGIV